jgi:hypothetical protein
MSAALIIGEITRTRLYVNLLISLCVNANLTNLCTSFEFIQSRVNEAQIILYLMCEGAKPLQNKMNCKNFVFSVNVNVQKLYELNSNYCTPYTVLS